jgi:hypothetical protein
MHWVYGDYSSVEPAAWSQYYASRMVVTPLNDAASELNRMMLDGLTGGERTSLSHDYAVVETSEANHYAPEFLHALEPNGMPPHELRLRPGALMILLRNYAPQKGLCNGTRVVVRGLWRRLLQIQVVTGPARGRIELLPRIVCDSTGDSELPFTLRRLQFPVRPAWAISINKAQGQTVDGRFGIYLPSPVFAHGQLHVANMRATASMNVRILGESYEDQQRKLPLGSGRAALYTLNLVDETLLDDCRWHLEGPSNSGPSAPQEQPASTDEPRMVGEKPHDPNLDAGSEAHRLAMVSPEPLSGQGSLPSLLWDTDGACRHPHTADEWATIERGQPCMCAGVADLGSSLEDRSMEDMEYKSETDEVGMGFYFISLLQWYCLEYR